MTQSVRRAAPLALALFALALQGCSMTREVRPVGKGNVAAGLSVGGPLFTNLGGAIPTPILSPYVRYGLLKNLDLDFALDLTPAAVQGADIGLGYEFRDQKGGIPAVMGGARVYGFGNMLAGTDRPAGYTGKYTLAPTAFEEIYGNVSWIVARHWLLYAGVDLFAQAEQGIFIPSVLVGAEYRFTHVGIQAELKEEGFDVNKEFSTVEFLGPNHYGALAFQLGLNIYFGGTR